MNMRTEFPIHSQTSDDDKQVLLTIKKILNNRNVMSILNENY